MRADNVGGQEVRRELDAVKVKMEPTRDGAHRECFGQAGNALDEHVAAGKKPKKQAIDHAALTDNDAADLVVEGIE